MDMLARTGGKITPGQFCRLFERYGSMTGTLRAVPPYDCDDAP
jgi:hypothetical protein